MLSSSISKNAHVIIMSLFIPRAKENHKLGTNSQFFWWFKMSNNNIREVGTIGCTNTWIALEAFFSLKVQ